MKSNQLTDTHFHLSLSDDIEKILKEAKEVGVSNFIISACDLKSIEEGLEIINKYEDIYLTIGIHPDEITSFNDNTIAYLEKLILNNKKIIGIGEIGLDYYHNKENKEEQRRIFKLQLDLATKLNLPVVIHTRDAFLDTYNILKEYSLKGTIHCFTLSLECANMYIKLGYLLGIGGVSTYKNANLKNVLNPDWLNNSNMHIITFDTLKERLTFQVFSVYTIEETNDYLYINFENKDQYQKYLDREVKRSVKDFEVEITSNDKILTLSTCYIDEHHRLVLHAKLIGAL